MTLPRLTAEQAVNASTASNYTGASRMAGREQIVSMVDIGCLERCVGAQAAAECARCGSDPGCWNKCAGSGAAACVHACF